MVNVGKEGVSEVNEALDRGYVLKALTDLRDKLIRAKAREVVEKKQDAPEGAHKDGGEAPPAQVPT